MRRPATVLFFLCCVCGIAGLQWAPTLQDGAQVTACEREDISLPWSYALERSEVMMDVQWYYQPPGQAEEIYATYVAGRLLTMGQDVEFLPNAGLLIHQTSLTHSGVYSVHVNVHNATGPPITYTSSANVIVAIPPTTSDNRLHLEYPAGATEDRWLGQWAVELECGHFTNLGQPSVNVDWITPSGAKRNSTAYANGTYILALTDPATSGNYSCQLSRDSPATKCVPAGSPLLETSSVQIDGKDVKVAIMEAREQGLKDQIQRLEAEKEALANHTQACKLENNQLHAEIRRLQNIQVPVTCTTGNPTTPSTAAQPTLDPTHRPKSCVEVRQYDPADGPHVLHASDLFPPIPVFCDQTTDGGGWAVFQRRMDGSVDFYRNWTEYQRGFGDLSGEFWLGLENLHILTTTSPQELRVDLEDWEGNRAYAKYSGFVVADSADNYRLHYDSYTEGTAGDSLARQNNQQFSTPGTDNDIADDECAVNFKGAWWYSNCHDSNLNGLYMPNSTARNEEGLLWVSFKGYFYSMKFAEMKMRPM